MSWSRNMIGWFMKTYLLKPIKILQFLLPGKIKKIFNITWKYFSIFNNKPLTSWVAHITRDFITYSSCSYCTFMLFHMKAEVFLKYFVHDYMFKSPPWRKIQTVYCTTLHINMKGLPSSAKFKILALTY